MGLGALFNNQLGHGPKFQKLHIHSLPISGRRNWTSFCSMGSGFRDNGWFSKLPYLDMKLACLAIGQNFRSGTYTLFYPGVQNRAHSHSTDTTVFELLADFQICHISTWIPEVAHILSFFSKGLKLRLFFALRSAVSEIRADFQNCHIWAWNLASGQSSSSSSYTLFLPQGGEIKVIFAVRAAVSEIRSDFQNCHIWAWNLASGQSSRSCTYTLFLPQRV